MNIIVTGGAGFIGSALCRYLIQETDANILNIDSLTYAANTESLKSIEDNPRYRLAQKNICNAEDMEQLFTEFKPDTVLHLAAESHVDRSIDGPRAFIETNVIGTFTLLNTALLYWKTLSKVQQEAFRFINVSTDEVYGSLGATGLFEETTPYQPNSPYSASKASADHLARAWFHTYGMPVITTNCSNNYGPCQFPEKLIPLTILNALEGKPLPIYGTGENIRDWLYVEDHVRALWIVAQSGTPGNVYNIGGNSEKQNIDIVKTICKILDDKYGKLENGKSRTDLITYVEDRPGHDKRYAIDASKIKAELSWEPAQTFENGLRETIDWYLNNQDWWEPLRQDVYTGQRLGLEKMNKAS